MTDADTTVAELQNQPRPYDILMMEDDRGDAELIRLSFASIGVAVRLHVVPDGVEGLAFLRCEGIHAAAPRPSLILLDLNMPGKDGFAVLRELKTDPWLFRIPIVVFTTSDNPIDVESAYALRANAYMTKPADLDAFVDAVRYLSDYWLGKVSLPPTRS